MHNICTYDDPDRATKVPLMRTGGASSGMFSFPPEALKPPGCVGARHIMIIYIYIYIYT